MPNHSGGVCLLYALSTSLDSPPATSLKVIQDPSALVYSHCIAALPDSTLQLFHNAVVKALLC